MVEKMRTKFLMTVSALAIATPAMAADLYTPYVPPAANDPIYSPQQMVVGHLQLGLGYADLEEYIFDDDFSGVGVFEGAGRANIAFGTMNFEIETGGFSFFSDGSSYSSIGAAGHLWTKLNGAAIGAFAAVNFPTGATIGSVGLEGEAYLGNVTLGAQGGYNWGDGGLDFWSAAGWADYYVTPDFRLGGEVDYFNSDGSNLWIAALDTEYRFSGTPFSLWGEVSYSMPDGGSDVVAGLLGFRVFMDGAGTSLHQHDMDVPWDGGLLDQGLLLSF